MSHKGPRGFDPSDLDGGIASSSSPFPGRLHTHRMAGAGRGHLLCPFPRAGRSRPLGIWEADEETLTPLAIGSPAVWDQDVAGPTAG